MGCLKDFASTPTNSCFPRYFDQMLFSRVSSSHSVADQGEEDHDQYGTATVLKYCHDFFSMGFYLEMFDRMQKNSELSGDWRNSAAVPSTLAPLDENFLGLQDSAVNLVVPIQGQASIDCQTELVGHFPQMNCHHSCHVDEEKSQLILTTQVNDLIQTEDKKNHSWKNSAVARSTLAPLDEDFLGLQDSAVNLVVPTQGQASIGYETKLVEGFRDHLDLWHFPQMNCHRSCHIDEEKSQLILTTQMDDLLELRNAAWVV